jgi:hypothetical protein
MRRLLGPAMAAAVVVAALSLAPGSALAGTLDQQQLDASGGSLAIDSGLSHAQTFTAGLSGAVDQVDLDLQTVGTPTPPLSVEIRDVSGGMPGTTVLASHSVPASSIPASLAFVAINFASPAPVVAGTQYAIVAYGSNIPPNEYGWGVAVGNPYPGGGQFYVMNSPPSGAWTGPGGDLAFKTYVAPTTPTPTGRRAAALKKCKKKFRHNAKKRKRCIKKAKRLPV